MERAGYRRHLEWYDLGMLTQIHRTRRLRAANIAVEIGTTPTSETVDGPRTIIPLERYVAVRFGTLAFTVRRPWAVSVSEAGHMKVQRIPDVTRRAQLGAALAAPCCLAALLGVRALASSNGQEQEAKP